jgi:hypothetical protein
MLLKKSTFRSRIKSLLCISLSASLATMTPALAQQGEVRSIVMEAFDAETGQPVSVTSVIQGQRVRLEAKAYDGLGNSIPCTPRFDAIQGFTGNQINIEGNILTGGTNFGSAEIKSSCAEYPDFSQKTFVSVDTLRQAAPPAPTAGGGAGSGLMLVLGGLGIAALAVGLSGAGEESSSGGGGSSCPSGSHACNPSANPLICCPNGTTVYCPNSRTCTNLTGSGSECGAGQPRQSC